MNVSVRSSVLVGLLWAAALTAAAEPRGRSHRRPRWKLG
jgi:hypothetical protein